MAPVAAPHRAGIRHHVIAAIAAAAVALAALAVAASSPAGAVVRPPRPISDPRPANTPGLGHGGRRHWASSASIHPHEADMHTFCLPTVTEIRRPRPIEPTTW